MKIFTVSITEIKFLHIGLNLASVEIVGANFDLVLLACMTTGMPRFDNFQQVNTILFAMANGYLEIIIGH